MEGICDTPADNWLAETPEVFTSRRLGRQSVERERVSGIDWNEILRKKP
ncbi:hypothetical protein ACIP97_24840 [Peribacillus frigoritolerans]